MSEDLCIVWQPQRCSGRPTIGHSRLPASSVAAYVWAGQTVEAVARDYEITPEQVRMACWWLATHDPGGEVWKRSARKQWRKWADEWHVAVWWPNKANPHPGNPPRRETT